MVLTPLCETPEVTMSMNLHFRFHESLNANGEIIQQTGLNLFNSHGKDQGVS